MTVAYAAPPPMMRRDKIEGVVVYLRLSRSIAH